MGDELAALALIWTVDLWGQLVESLCVSTVSAVG